MHVSVSVYAVCLCVFVISNQSTSKKPYHALILSELMTCFIKFVAHLSINSLRNKFENLNETLTNKVDILLISETKLDSSFPLNQFHIDGFTTPYRLDRDQNGGGIMLYIRGDILRSL